jgi:VIT1/CCC1 family predicted Fe2+/Mn2+ transporter
MAVPSVTALLQAVRTSFSASFGNVVFGMEDGTVSIFGLVFGVAASAANSRVVLLAGSTGAAAAAIAMMAGTYLDALSTRGQARARIASEKQAIEQNRPSELAKVMERLHRVGLDDRDSIAIIDVLDRHPDLLLQVETAFELQIAGDDQRSPLVQSLWMFFADLLAAFIPVIPFAFFSLDTARIVSISITAILLLLLGIARGIVAKSSLLRGALETLGIATAAAITGFFIGRLVTL